MRRVLTLVAVTAALVVPVGVAFAHHSYPDNCAVNKHLTVNGDFYVGGNGVDCIGGRGGHDIIEGRGGADYLGGGDGNDQLRGEDGTDNLQGDAGIDSIRGGVRGDLIHGDDGDDTIYDGPSEPGNGDYIHGLAGEDTLYHCHDPEHVLDEIFSIEHHVHGFPNGSGTYCT